MKPILWTLLLLVNVALQPAQAAKIEPADVYLRVSAVEAEIELIRLYMGKPEAGSPAFYISGAAPREVYFQALTLLRKTGRMSKEHTGGLVEVPKSLPRDIQPHYVLEIVDKVQENVFRVKAALGISKRIAAPVRDASKTSSDVFQAIANANRQVNPMLEYVLAPTDVYEKVVLATRYAVALTGKPTARIAYECCKQPIEVFHQLVEAFGLLEVMANKSDIRILDLEPGTRRGVLPDEVYDLAMLILSELSFLSQKAGIPVLEAPDYDGRKFPADVYRQAVILKTLLTEGTQ